jgi:hypothetical protein
LKVQTLLCLKQLLSPDSCKSHLTSANAPQMVGLSLRQCCCTI